jgi:D-tyrosyl-tRNA(Tyr) deacylase
MRAVVQRVLSASVTIDGAVTSSIQRGLLVLLAVAPDDVSRDCQWLAGKLSRLRVFNDADGKMNLSVKDIGGEVLIVSQFTLYGDCRRGNRPGFSRSAGPDIAVPLYRQFIEDVKDTGVPVQTGVFGADMKIELINDGPVTLVIDTP